MSVTTLDNPGWSISVDLEDTELEDVPFAELRKNMDDDLDWLICTKQSTKFSGDGGPRQLERIISIFLDWAQETRLAQECAKLDSVEEQAFADEGMKPPP